MRKSFLALAAASTFAGCSVTPVVPTPDASYRISEPSVPLTPATNITGVSAGYQDVPALPNPANALPVPVITPMPAAAPAKACPETTRHKPRPAKAAKAPPQCPAR